jgi:polyisoprenoid-binding protein YceI
MLLCVVNPTKTVNLQKMDIKNFTIERAKSSIEWVGKKVTGAHNGTVDIADGVLTLTDGELTGGQFNIDTRSIRILDVTDLNTNTQFAGHLASEDFFAAEAYPTASLDITSVSQGRNGHEGIANYRVAANLTIKGITQPIEFEAAVGTVKGDTLRASARVVVDRTKYGMKFRSGNFFKDLGDTLIFNDFTLNVLLAAKAA